MRTTPTEQGRLGIQGPKSLVSALFSTSPMEEARDQALPEAEEVCCSSGTTPYQKSLNLQAAAPPGPGACLWHISMVHGTFANLEAYFYICKACP